MTAPAKHKGAVPARSVLFYVLVALMPVASGLFRVWVHQDAVQKGYALSAQERRRDGLRARLHELEVEVAAARSPARLTRVASELGLRPAAAHQLMRAPLYVRRALPHLARADGPEARHATR